MILAGLSPALFLAAWLASVPASPLMMLALFIWLILISIRQTGDDAQQKRNVFGS